MRVVDEFRNLTGHDPEVVGSAPGRVNLLGEHLDYNGGRSLPLALGYRTRVATGSRDDGLLVVHSRQGGETVRVPLDGLDARRGDWSDYVVGVAWAMQPSGTGWTLLVDGDVPQGAGLSSSAALECAVAVALDAVSGCGLSRGQLVSCCVRAENEYVGAPTGSMDQTVAMFAAPHHALLVDFAAGEHRPVRWQPPGELLVVDTRAPHALVSGEYAERRARCEEAASLLGVPHLAHADPESLGLLTDAVTRRRARHVVTEQSRVAAALAALDTGDWERFGQLMNQSHASLRDDYEVSCPELDTAVDAAVAAGALGARMTGGGFGGSAIALVPPGGGEAVRDAVESAFATQGFRAPRFLDGSPGRAADVVTP